jgi:dCTP diphosphatase
MGKRDEIRKSADTLDLQPTQARLQEFAEARDWNQFHSPKNLTMALAAEAGELLEVFQWLSEEESRNLSDADRARATEEMADVQIYLARLADVLGIDMNKAVEAKIALNEEKYPADIVRGTARRPPEDAP